ncbi:MAG: DHHA1 domain-containing protein [Lachnospiraceae bacterium]|nr:DHHA1 domain-containing protein [Lachnospiraceae bacterium]
MNNEKWMVYGKRADFAAIAEECGIDQVTARIAVNRGVPEEKMKSYFNPGIDDLSDPHLMTDLDRGVSIIKEAIETGTKIRVIGDYDVDGINSTYILLSGLCRAGAEADYAIPRRIEDGYGLNPNMVRAAKDDGIGCIITCDNGIAADDATSLALELGMKVVVTDHHQVPYRMEAGSESGTAGAASQAEDGPKAAEGAKDNAESKHPSVDAKAVKVETLPHADAVIDPHRAGDAYPFKEICGAVVAWKFVIALYEACGIDRAEADEFLGNAAFATVCDVMPLKEENRVIVKYGLEAMKNTTNPGLKALIERKDLSDKPFTSYTFGFVLGPCLNAAGRLDTAALAMDLLLAKTPEEAAPLAARIVTMNDERKALTEQGVNEGLALMKDYDLEKNPVIVLFLPDIHESIAGLVAGRIKETYYHPTFVITRGEDCAKGSGRSIEAYSMYDEMKAAEHLFIKWGGHPMAAGLSLKEEDVDEFRRILNENAHLTREDFTKKIMIDVPMPLDYLVQHSNVIDEIERLEPTGTGNEKPLFAVRDVPVTRIRSIGRERHFWKVTFPAGDTSIDALYFGDADEFHDYYVSIFGESEWQKALAGTPSGLRMTIAYETEWNVYNGRKMPQIMIRHYK